MKNEKLLDILIDVERYDISVEKAEKKIKKLFKKKNKRIKLATYMAGIYLRINAINKISDPLEHVIECAYVASDELIKREKK